jgi:hypothetical protein
MTWSAKITDSEGNVPEGKWQACEVCKHGNKRADVPLPTNLYRPCYVPSIGSQVASLLTSIDTGADGHQAGGSAILKCSGFEPMG